MADTPGRIHFSFDYWCNLPLSHEDAARVQILLEWDSSLRPDELSRVMIQFGNYDGEWSVPNPKKIYVSGWVYEVDDDLRHRIETALGRALAVIVN